MSFISAELGLDKTAAQKNGAKLQTSVSKTAAGLYDGDASLYKTEQGLQAQNLPLMEQGVLGLQKNTTQAGRDALVSDFGARQTGAAESRAAHAADAFPTTPGLATGFALDAMNQANTNTAHYDQDVNSPTNQLQSIMAFLQAAQGLAPNASGLNANAGAVLGNPQANANPSNPMLGSIGSIVGSLAGAGVFG